MSCPNKCQLIRMDIRVGLTISFSRSLKRRVVIGKLCTYNRTVPSTELQWSGDLVRVGHIASSACYCVAR